MERVYAVTARYYRTGVLTEHLRRDLAAIDAYRPDIVVTDMQPTAVLAARLRGLPVVSLADTDFLYDEPCPWMPWNTASPTKLLPHPDALTALSELAVGQGLPRWAMSVTCCGATARWCRARPRWSRCPGRPRAGRRRTTWGRCTGTRRARPSGRTAVRAITTST